MSEFKQYVRTNIAEMRPYVGNEELEGSVSVSQVDSENGSPKIGDMIARNPLNHKDQWLVAEKYFLENFAEKEMTDEDLALESRNVSFGVAIDALKLGKRVSRHIWEETAFVFMQVPAEIDQDIVPKMQSLPQTVKDYFQETFDDPFEQIDAIYYSNQLALVGPSNIIVGYTAQPADILAEDWIILD